MAKIYSLKAGSKVPDDILAIAREERIATARVEAIGGVRGLRLAYFNQDSRKYEEHDYREFLEVTGLLGNITLKDGEPFLHAHGTFGRRDMSVIGGHVMAATVSPLMEVVITPTKNRALRRFDEELQLNVIYRS
ncbi:MAG: DNA-binding protein [Nitrososphaerota archaeon]|nr:DNA-binding protein [Nitrososphaerota archaeon]